MVKCQAAELKLFSSYSSVNLSDQVITSFRYSFESPSPLLVTSAHYSLRILKQNHFLYYLKDHQIISYINTHYGDKWALQYPGQNAFVVKITQMPEILHAIWQKMIAGCTCIFNINKYRDTYELISSHYFSMQID